MYIIMTLSMGQAKGYDNCMYISRKLAVWTAASTISLLQGWKVIQVIWFFLKPLECNVLIQNNNNISIM